MISPETWLLIREIAIDIIQYGFPTIAIGLSIVSFLDSRKSSKIQDRLIQVEEKLKRYELEEKEKERKDASRANVEARVIKISKGKYRMKIWNSGKATAYNVNFNIPEEYRSIVLKSKVPYEFLEAGKSFEEHVLVHNGTPNKLRVITTWANVEGEECSKEQIVDVY